VNRDILPERTWGAVNSQVPSKVFGGEGPQLAWGEESAKRSERVCAVPQGDRYRKVGFMAIFAWVEGAGVGDCGDACDWGAAWPRSLFFF
jgi:hypothetical protein